MIGIFDSGVGGLSVLNEIRRLIPSAPLLYFADTRNIPYGDKSEDFISKRSLEISRFLRNQGAEILVIACNTATAAGAELIRDSLDVPVVAVEPPVKPATLVSVSRVIGVIATKLTLGSKRFRSLVDIYAKDIRVIERPSNDLVPIVENFSWKEKEGQEKLLSVVAGFLEKGVDAVVLGSTHFSFLTDSLIEISKGKLIPIGSAEATAQQVLKISKEKEIDHTGQGQIKILVSGDAGRFRENLKHFSDCQAEVISSDSYLI